MNLDDDSIAKVLDDPDAFAALSAADRDAIEAHLNAKISPQFMVTVAPHGRLSIEPMRFFTGARAEFDARAYVATIPREDGVAVMYKVGHNTPPEKVQGVYQGRATRGT